MPRIVSKGGNSWQAVTCLRGKTRAKLRRERSQVKERKKMKVGVTNTKVCLFRTSRKSKVSFKCIVFLTKEITSLPKGNN